MSDEIKLEKMDLTKVALDAFKNGSKVVPPKPSKETIEAIEEKFPKHVFHHGNMLAVFGNFEDFKPEELKKNKGYIYNGRIYQYKDTNVVNQSKYPTIYLINGKIKTAPDISDQYWDSSMLRYNSMTVISHNTDPDRKFYKEQQIATPSSSTAIYTPEIDPKDDFLKKIIKTIFSLKQVATTKYKKLAKKAYMVPNLLQGLNGSTKTSVTAWNSWIELLGVDCYIIVKDNGEDKDSPIGKYILYNSRHDGIDCLSKEEVLERLDKGL